MISLKRRSSALNRRMKRNSRFSLGNSMREGINSIKREEVVSRSLNHHSRKEITAMIKCVSTKGIKKFRKRVKK
jgi:hypothetical protein